MNLKKVMVTFVIGMSFAGSTHAIAILSNNTAPGDSFTNAGTSGQGQAVGTSGWYYNNVRNSGIAGISTTYPRNGNGSAYLETQIGPGGASSKADIEYLANGTLFQNNYYAGGSLGLFSTLGSFSYDWFRDSSSTNSAAQHPALRVLLDADGDLTTVADRGGLVFERAYNGGGVSTNTWVNDLVSATGVNIWNFGLGLDFAYGGFGQDLSDWKTILPDAAILGFSAGVGSGWGPFKGAVDNVSWTIGTTTTTSNFEVMAGTVPAPATLALFGLGLAGLGWSRRKKV